MWKAPLVEFLTFIGVKATPTQLLLIDNWLHKHNKRQQDAIVDLQHARYKAQRFFISQN